MPDICGTYNGVGELSILYVEDGSTFREAVALLIRDHVRVFYPASDAKEGLALFGKKDQTS